MRMKLLALAAGALMAGVGAAHAATVTNDLHLRAGPGTNYPVIGSMPAGAHVNIRNCTGGWCRLSYNGEVGWASDNYLAQGGRTTTVYRTRRVYSPPVYTERVYEPAVVPDYDYVYGSDLGYAYEPGFSIGFGFGGFDGGWHHGWRGGWHHWR